MRPTSDLATRSTFIDVVRGYLVILMVVYHATIVLYGTSYSNVGEFIVTQLGFLHSAFLAVAGFLVGWHYCPKARERGADASRRLIVRALKLGLLYFLVNVLIVLLGLGPSIQTLSRELATWDRLVEQCLLRVNGSLFSFEILVYIATYLLLAGIFLSRYLVGIFLALVLFAYILFPCNLSAFLLIGGIGEIVGMMWKRLRDIHKLPHWIWVSAFLYFRLMEAVQSGTSIAASGVFVALDTAVWFGAFWVLFTTLRATQLNSFLSHLGRYTLCAYMAHMGFVVGLHKVCQHFGVSGTLVYVSTVATTFMFLVGFVRVLNITRNRYTLFNRAYRFAFE